MQTEVEICNIALGRIGNRQYIDALDDASVVGEACSFFYENARDVVLASFEWPWATRRSVLAVLADDEDDAEARAGWGFTYALPTNCVTPVAIYPEGEGERGLTPELRYPYKLENDEATGRSVLLTDLEDAELIHVAKLTAVGLFPPFFVDALAWKLAADLALVLPVKPQVGLAMEQRFERAIAKAWAGELNKEQEEVEPDSYTIRIRE